MNALTLGITADRVARFVGDRGDGYHHNDPNAPDVFRCGCCDAIREHEVQWCNTCLGMTGGYVDRQVTDGLIHLGSRWPEEL